MEPFSATSLNVSGGTLKLSPSTSVLSISSLLVSSTAPLDITTDAADSAGNLPGVTALAQQGCDGGRWNGSGIISSNAASDAKRVTAVGVIQNNQNGTAIDNLSHPFLNTTPDPSDILIAYTFIQR